MKIYMNNAEECIAVWIGLCGELEKEAVLARAPLAKKSVYRAIKNLSDAKVINTHRYDDGKRFLRLSSVNGESYLGSISPALAANACQIVNSDLKYSGSKEQRLKERYNSELYFDIMSKGIPINDIESEYLPKGLFEEGPGKTPDGASIFLEDKTPLPFDDLVKVISEGYTGFFTKKIIKKRSDGSLVHEGSIGSRASGTLITGKQAYQIYTFGDPESTAWKPDSEFTAANFVLGSLQRNAPYFKGKDIRIESQALLTFPGPEIAGKMLLPSEHSLRIDPCKIFEKSYVRPALSLDSVIQILLSTPEWERIITDTLFPDGEIKGIEDKTLPDGTEVFNFIGCNLNRMRYAEPRILGADKRPLIIAEEWMSPYLHKAYGKENIEIVSVKDSEIRLIAEATA